METWVRMTDRACMLLESVQGFSNDERVVASRTSMRFQVVKFTGKTRKIRANIYSTINVSVESSHFLLSRLIRRSSMRKSD